MTDGSKIVTTEQAQKLGKPSNFKLGRPEGGIVPQDVESLWRLSKIFAMSGMMPKGVETPEKVFVAIEHGMELGLSPMAAVQSIAVINGKPSIYGDAALGLVMASGLLEDIEEVQIRDDAGEVVGYRCTVKRRGMSPVVHEFFLSDAQRAGLTKKGGPWAQYPRRMLQMRARSWALRDAFPDVLKGVWIAEEAMDIDESAVVLEADAPESGDVVEDLKQRLVAATEPAPEPDGAAEAVTDEPATGVEAPEQSADEPAEPEDETSSELPWPDDEK